LEAGLPKEKVRVILDEFESIDAGFDIVEEGDLLVIQPVEIQAVIEYVRSKKEKYEGKVNSR